LQAAQDKQSELNRRYEALRTKVLNSGGRPLSEREKAWITEVKTLSASLQQVEDQEEDQPLISRLETVSFISLAFASVRNTHILSRSNALPGTLWPKPSLSRAKCLLRKLGLRPLLGASLRCPNDCNGPRLQMR
jgi:hypothetical protein